MTYGSIEGFVIFTITFLVLQFFVTFLIKYWSFTSTGDIDTVFKVFGVFSSDYISGDILNIVVVF